MFDVQVLGGAAPDADRAVASIAAYYRRVTTDAAPMGWLVGTVMVAALAAATREAVRDVRRRRLRVLVLALLAGPVTLAAVRVFPNAVRLGAGGGAPAEQLALAQAILWDHLYCLAAIAAALGVHVALALRGDGPRAE